MPHHNPDIFCYRAEWLLTPQAAFCQLMLLYQQISQEEFAGYCVGYAGHGEWVDVPFYTGLPRMHAAITFFGEKCEFAGREIQFSQWTQRARQAAMQARLRTRMLLRQDQCGFFVATALESEHIAQLDADRNVGFSGKGTMDERVWIHIPHVMGVSEAYQLSLATRALHAEFGDRGPALHSSPPSSPWRPCAPQIQPRYLAVPSSKPFVRAPITA